MKLFISYARVDKPLCKQIVERLSDVHEVWYDQRLHVGQAWWEEIQRKLAWCEGLVYLLSPESVTSEYCRKEHDIARERAKYIFPVLIQANTDIPDWISTIHYADFSEGLEGLKDLLDGVTEAERRGPLPQQVQPPFLESGETFYPPTISTPIGTAADAMDADNYDSAVYILKQAQQTINDSDVLSIIAKMLETAEQGLERQAYLRDASRKYAPILELVKRESTRVLGCLEFADFQREFHGYDPEQLDQLCRDFSPGGDDVLANDLEKITIWDVFGVPRPDDTQPVAAVKEAGSFVPPNLSDILPQPFERCEIPAGDVTISYGDQISDRTFRIERFWISKYPITNAQYQVFMDSDEGYSNTTWWKSLPGAWEWRGMQAPKTTVFGSSDIPRTNISWYEAMIFCKWLSWKAELIALFPEDNQEIATSTISLRLPTEQEWQRAAQGDDGRQYPWGVDFQPSRVNAFPSRKGIPTSVTSYPGGVSPYGVFDMSGNVWEMTISDWEDTAKGDRIVLRGGSYGSAASEVSTVYRASQLKDDGAESVGFRIIAHAQS